MYVKDVMTSTIKSVSINESYKEIWRTIFRTHTNALPVVNANGTLVGIITRDDLLRPMYPTYQEVFESIESVKDFEEMEDRMKELAGLKASDIMQQHVVFTRDTTLVMRALSRMIVRRVNQLPVLNEKDVVIGIVTKGDIFTSLFRKNFKDAKKKSPHLKIKTKVARRRNTKS